jgi:hypothetical protein
MKVSIKTNIERTMAGPWTVRFTVKAGGKVKPKWTTTLLDGYPSGKTRPEVVRDSRATDQAIRNLFRNDRSTAATAAALKRWWKRRQAA